MTHTSSSNFREPEYVRLWTTTKNGHRHVAIFDEHGNGYTTNDGDHVHFHVVKWLDVLPAQGHSHELTAIRVKETA